MFPLNIFHLQMMLRVHAAAGLERGAAAGREDDRLTSSGLTQSEQRGGIREAEQQQQQQHPG